MSELNHQIIKKYILDLLLYYKCSPKNINNNKLKFYLMSRHLYPGTNGFQIIENYFMSKLKLRRSIFNTINSIFKPFMIQLFNFYDILINQNVQGKIIIKYRNHLTDFFCWLILNDINNFVNVNIFLCMDYIHSKHYNNLYSTNDISDFLQALNYYYKIYHYKDFNTDEVASKIHWYQFSYEITNSEIFNLYNHMQNKSLKLLVTLILHMGLSAKILLNLKVKDIDLYDQCLTYSGNFSGYRLVCPFDQNSKTKITSLFTIPESEKLFDSQLSIDSNQDYLYRQFSFALLNARLPAEKARSILNDLHIAVLSGKFYKN
ncbi:MAG: hypothetical protein OEV78_00820 [Spirochaetia bacterium]|nr:hypothetical protein [Spirochaetia bacterium]